MSRNQKYSTILIGGVDYGDYFRFPCMVNKALDESLDFAQIELHHMRRKDPFKPFTPVVMGQGSSALSYIVAVDEVTALHGTRLYKHVLTLMEQTKETERIMCGAKAFTNPLVRDYSDGKTLVYGWFVEPYSGASGKIEYLVLDGEMGRADKFSSPFTGKNITLYNDTFGWLSANPGLNVKTYGVKIAYKSGKSPIELEYSNGRLDAIVINESDVIYEKNITPGSGDVIGTYTASNHGMFAVVYEITFSDNSQRTVVFEVGSVAEPVTKSPYTVEDVVNHLLETSETIRMNPDVTPAVWLDSPRYTLRYKDTEQARKFQQPAPEFRFSNGRSLWENLLEVGRYVHAIPRVVGKNIEFDELGGTEYADLSKGTPYGSTTSLNIGDYTAGLEAMAANLVNLDDDAEGSVTEPFAVGYQSLRAATETARIGEETGIIKTANPVEKLIKVEVSVTHKGATYTGDITPYIFEKSEYDLLSSYRGAYPSSKTYALYYTQGSPNIEGLWYKAQDAAVSALNAFEDYSITNVVSAATGAPTGILTGMDYSAMMFRVTYVPSVTARVRHYKPNYDGSFGGVMAYNQSANKLSSRAFGENLRGQLAMLGTTSDGVMYMFKRLEDVPEPGTLYDKDNYISSVTARVYHDFVLAKINLSTGYNQLGARVEINNAIRQFEIPGAEDRYTVLEEFVEIGKKTADDANTAATAALKTEVLRAFASQSKGMDVSLAEVTTKDDDGKTITDPPVALPVISLALGNSLYFGWRFESNFAAGSKSSAGGSKYRTQDYVPYGDDFYAHAKTVGFKLSANATVSGNALTSAHALPESTGIGDGTVMVDTGDYPVLWHKDSADAGCLSYQLHYITNDDIIIGDGIAYHCAAVRATATPQSATIYFYPHRINQLTGTTETSGFVAAYPVTVDLSRNCLTYIGTPAGFKSWAIIKGGKFMLGKNTEEAPGDIYFNFQRRYKQ